MPARRDSEPARPLQPEQRRASGDGLARSFTTMAVLIDTYVFVERNDERFRKKQRIAIDFLRA